MIAALYQGKYIVLNNTFATRPTGVEGGEGELTVEGLAAWTIAAQGNGISIGNSGKYLSWTSKSNISNSTSAFEWSIAAGEATGAFRISTGTRFIAYQYSDSNDAAIIRNRFGAHAFPQSDGIYEFDLYLFKVVEE